MHLHTRFAALATVLVLTFTLGQFRAAASSSDPYPGGIRPAWLSKSKVVQDPRFLAAKLAGRVFAPATRRGGVNPNFCYPDPCPGPAPSAYTLDTSVPQYVMEPEGGSPIAEKDDAGASYVDDHYWRFCTAGASAVTLYYTRPTNVTSWPAGTFTEPYGPNPVSTYWRSSDTDFAWGYSTQGRAYLMYLAEQVMPNGSGWVTPGVIDFNTVSGSLPDVRDVLNWEASGHATNWVNYFYVDVAYSGGGLSASVLHSDVKTDTWNYKTSVVAFANTSYLPDWKLLNVVHAISIVGYDDNAGNYYYVDTCSSQCGSGHNTPFVHTISQAQLYTAIQNARDGLGNLVGGIVW